LSYKGSGKKVGVQVEPHERQPIMLLEEVLTDADIQR
jgi:hypothetical protein